MLFARIRHTISILHEDIKRLTDTHWILVCIFVGLNGVDWIITSISRILFPDFKEFNPFLNVFVADPLFFSLTILLFKILQVVVLLLFVVYIDKIDICKGIQPLNGISVLIYANAAMLGILALMFGYNLLPELIV